MVQGTCLPSQTAWGLPIRKFQTHLPTSASVFWSPAGTGGFMSTAISVQVVFQGQYCYSIWSIGIVCSWCCVAGLISPCRGSALAFCLCPPASVLAVVVATGGHMDALPHGSGITVFKLSNIFFCVAVEASWALKSLITAEFSSGCGACIQCGETVYLQLLVVVFCLRRSQWVSLKQSCSLSIVRSSQTLIVSTGVTCVSFLQ